MSEANKRTLNSYNQRVDEYITGTPAEVDGDIKLWIDKSLGGLALDAKIFEVGSAFGRDADYIESLGYQVERSDATSAFVELLRANGHQAKDFNLITDDFEKDYDLIFADAVLLHFNRQEVAETLPKVHSALKPDGRLAFSLRQGQGEEWTNAKLEAPRYFCYWSQAEITNLLERSGFSQAVEAMDTSERHNSQWLHIVANKQTGS